jgi:hypothetical protein
MPPKRVRRAAKPFDNSPSSLAVTLGEEIRSEQDELAPSSPPANITTPSYPSPPPPENAANIQGVSDDDGEEEEEEGKGVRMVWSLEMQEQLVDTLYEVFIAGGGADNSFKKATFEKVAVNVRKVYEGSNEINWLKCKNKWADFKKKWGHWMILSAQSGVGFNEETELYEFYDYVWMSLNKVNPDLIWHKTHIMPFRDEISTILHNVQANGEGALSLEEPTVLDPRLKALNTTRALSSASPALSSASKTSKTLYKKSKKRAPIDISDGEDNDTLAPAKKVDLGVAISGLSKELALARRAKETFLTQQQKAVQLLEREYKNRLHIVAFVEALNYLKDEGNATNFNTIMDIVIRDRFLEFVLHTELQTPLS